jgi:hypothetical protein
VNWGSLNWLPDIRRWASIVTGLLAPGGYLYLVEQHPTIATMVEREGRIEAAIPWRSQIDQPDSTLALWSYDGGTAPLTHGKMHEWVHPMSEIIGSLVECGLILDFLHEHEMLPWRRLPMMVYHDDRMFRLPEEQVPMPLAFSLRAYKPWSSRYWRSSDATEE